MATKRVEDLNLQNIVNHQFQRAAQHLKYPGGLLEQIRACNAVYFVQFPVKFALSGSLEGKRVAIQGFGNVGYHVARFHSLRNFRGARTLPKGSDCLEVVCDLLVPAALENQIHRGNMKKIRTRVPAEAANGPTTPDALVRGASERDLVNSGLEATMITAFGEILGVKRRRRKVEDLRTAAYIVAIDKIANSYLELGIFP